MNAAQIHLAFNHIPVILTVTGGLLLLTALLRKNNSLQTTAAILLAVAAVFTVPVFLTGEGTEEITENLPGVLESITEKHEAMAKIALAVMLVTGLVASAALIFKHNATVYKNIMVITVILSFISFGVLAQTAHLGGMIRHTEIKSNTVQSNTNEAQPGEAKEAEEKNDD